MFKFPQMFSKKAIKDARLHAAKEAPKESCGLIINDEYRECKNISDDPENNFIIDPKDQLNHTQNGTLPISAVIHSHITNVHTDLEFTYPSIQDIQGQLDQNVPWGIIVVMNGHAREPYFWGEGVPIADYLERPFIYGVYDCYTIVRDYYMKEFGIKIHFEALEWKWWLKGKDPYGREKREETGFYNIEDGSWKTGDVLVGKLRCKVLNHVAVYLGNDLLLHHPGENVESRIEPVYRWLNHIEVRCRYKDLK